MMNDCLPVCLSLQSIRQAPLEVHARDIQGAMTGEMLKALSGGFRAFRVLRAASLARLILVPSSASTMPRNPTGLPGLMTWYA